MHLLPPLLVRHTHVPNRIWDNWIGRPYVQSWKQCWAKQVFTLRTAEWCVTKPLSPCDLWRSEPCNSQTSKQNPTYGMRTPENGKEHKISFPIFDFNRYDLEKVFIPGWALGANQLTCFRNLGTPQTCMHFYVYDCRHTYNLCVCDLVGWLADLHAKPLLRRSLFVSAVRAISNKLQEWYRTDFMQEALWILRHFIASLNRLQNSMWFLGCWYIVAGFELHDSKELYSLCACLCSWDLSHAVIIDLNWLRVHQDYRHVSALLILLLNVSLLAFLMSNFVAAQ